MALPFLFFLKRPTVLANSARTFGENESCLLRLTCGDTVWQHSALADYNWRLYWFQELTDIRIKQLEDSNVLGPELAFIGATRQQELSEKRRRGFCKTATKREVKVQARGEEELSQGTGSSTAELRHQSRWIFLTKGWIWPHPETVTFYEWPYGSKTKEASEKLFLFESDLRLLDHAVRHTYMWVVWHAWHE